MYKYKTILLASFATLATIIVITRYNQTIVEQTESDRMDSVAAHQYRQSEQKERNAIKKYQKQTADKRRSNIAITAFYSKRIKTIETDYHKMLSDMKTADSAKGQNDSPQKNNIK